MARALLTCRTDTPVAQGVPACVTLLPNCVVQAIALNLFQFLQSFSSGSSQDSLAMPANLIDRWFTRFQEKFRKDPEFFMRHAAAP